APPTVGILASRLLVPINTYISLTPALADEARSGFVEGPVMGLQVRHEVEFPMNQSDDHVDVDGEEKVGDVFGITREVTAALSLAQDRRKGPGEGRLDGETDMNLRVRFSAVGK